MLARSPEEKLAWKPKKYKLKSCFVIQFSYQSLQEVLKPAPINLDLPFYLHQEV